MGSFSCEDSFLPNVQVIFREEVHQFGRISILKDYIPHPNSIIDNEISEISKELEALIPELSICEKGPYISRTFGKVREEAFRKFEKIVNEYSEPKKSEYIRRFYFEIDQKYQHLFEKTFDLRELYSHTTQSKDTPSLAVLQHYEKEQNTTEIHLTNDQVIGLLMKDIKTLTIDWYILIEKTVDVLVKSELYGVKKGSIYRDLYKRIKNQRHNNDQQKSSWKQKIIPNWKPLSQLQNCSSQENDMPYAEAMDGRDLFTLVTLATCGEFISKLFKDIKEDSNNKELMVKTKGFLLFAKESLNDLLENLTYQFEQCLGKDANESLHILDKLINELVNFKDHVSAFDQRLSKNHYIHSQDKIWLKVATIERALSDMQRNKENSSSKAQLNMRSASSNTLS